MLTRPLGGSEFFSLLILYHVEQHFTPSLFLSRVLYRKHRHMTYGGPQGLLVEICLLFGRVLTRIEVKLEERLSRITTS